MRRQHFQVPRIDVAFFQHVDAPVERGQILLKLLDGRMVMFGPQAIPCSLCAHFFLPIRGHAVVSAVCGGNTKMDGRNQGCFAGACSSETRNFRSHSNPDCSTIAELQPAAKTGIKNSETAMAKPFPSKTHIGNHMLHPETLM